VPRTLEAHIVVHSAEREAVSWGLSVLRKKQSVVAGNREGLVEKTYEVRQRDSRHSLR
jgi:hypothetical protein